MYPYEQEPQLFSLLYRTNYFLQANKLLGKLKLRKTNRQLFCWLFESRTESFSKSFPVKIEKQIDTTQSQLNRFSRQLKTTQLWLTYGDKFFSKFKNKISESLDACKVPK